MEQSSRCEEGGAKRIDGELRKRANSGHTGRGFHLGDGTHIAQKEGESKTSREASVSVEEGDLGDGFRFPL